MYSTSTALPHVMYIRIARNSHKCELSNLCAVPHASIVSLASSDYFRLGIAIFLHIVDKIANNDT